MANDNIIWFEELGLKDLDEVGGKNASLGEMINNLNQADVRVPGGFATTAVAFRRFLAQDDLADKINDCLAELDVDDVKTLSEIGGQIRKWITDTPLLPDFIEAVSEAWHALQKTTSEGFSCAVRSSATAEDLPNASFAGQQETFLNVDGLDNILIAMKDVFASLYNDRAIAYRVHQGFAHQQVALSVGVQRMVRSDLASSGVAFTLDTESGFDKVVFITGSYGLGELVVQGVVNPDEFYVFKPSLQQKRSAIIRRHVGSKKQKMIYANDLSGHTTVATVDVLDDARQQFCLQDEEIEDLARQAMLIEQHYGRSMDIEWAKDGVDGKIYILQARPETVVSQQKGQGLERYHLEEKGDVIITGRSIGQRIGSGKVKVIKHIDEMHRVKAGDVLVTDMTDPDWEPIMKRASAIVTNRGGRTCHAAIIARELGIPAVVGCNNATKLIKDGDEVTVSCAEGDTGLVYSGLLDFKVQRLDIASMPELPFKIMMNVANPDRAFSFQSLPNAGVGLARLEFIINRMIGIHPKTLLNLNQASEALQEKIEPMIAAYRSPIDFYVDRLAEGIATIAAAFDPKPVIVRMSDFKSNEYANLIGGNDHEPDEENPMLGFRGASRYVADSFADCFALECQAIKKVRNEIGLTNVQVMIPFVRTVDEAKQIIEVLDENGLRRGEDGLRLIMMCEIPSNALLAEEFLQYFDGFSIGSNDLTQLTLGLDRDSGLVADYFDERNAAVKMLLSRAIKACKDANKYVGICGQGPSDYPDFAKWLMQEGIDSVSLTPDSVLETWLYLAES